ncbi:uncharacterized protein METZ01_LOCUS350550, partial [marine metagenome]
TTTQTPTTTTTTTVTTTTPATTTTVTTTTQTPTCSMEAIWICNESDPDYKSASGGWTYSSQCRRLNLSAGECYQWEQVPREGHYEVPVGSLLDAEHFNELGSFGIPSDSPLGFDIVFADNSEDACTQSGLGSVWVIAAGVCELWIRIGAFEPDSGRDPDFVSKRLRLEGVGTIAVPMVLGPYTLAVGTVLNRYDLRILEGSYLVTDSNTRGWYLQAVPDINGDSPCSVRGGITVLERLGTCFLRIVLLGYRNHPWPIQREMVIEVVEESAVPTTTIPIYGEERISNSGDCIEAFVILEAGSSTDDAFLFDYKLDETATEQ